MRRTLFVTVTALVALTACGGDDGTSARDAKADRTIRVTMRDIAYAPATIQVAAGETVRFVFTNDGKVDHDAFIGDAAAQADHEREMREADEAHDGHGSGDAGDAITVEPGRTGQLTYRFDNPGTIEVGCHEPGHYEAGMKIAVSVT